MSPQDPYTDPASGVLRNKLGLTDVAELERAEADLTGFRLIELHQHDLPGAYDLAHLLRCPVVLGPRSNRIGAGR
ncbi:hypothetical protein LWC35_18830 [Pseudonocardia kujensis]|uniref:hypothetical protein n=1 Tax=Pseudonocardia kujensis TaxID=1128675 RepID=UPI001E57248A|nr:hypothetical protein [Pseudonocardia kujensis]MCE0764941.1 hypothetical protein [Pseudonocardia kujensis]